MENCLKNAVLLLSIVLCCGWWQCAKAEGDSDASNPDRLERFNRMIFSFNDTIDEYFLKPIAILYDKVMPHPLNHGIHNAFNNINTLPTIANDILQLHLFQMTHDLWRFTVNTTLGVGGLFDVAQRIGLEPYSNDFGLTLAQYGWKDSTYLVLPFFGPSTFRDTIELPVDYYLFSIYPHIYPLRTRYMVYGLSVIDQRAQLLNMQSVMEEAALDRYIFLRDAYLQRRAFQIKENYKRNFISQTSVSED